MALPTKKDSWILEDYFFWLTQPNFWFLRPNATFLEPSILLTQPKFCLLQPKKVVLQNWTIFFSWESHAGFSVQSRLAFRLCLTYARAKISRDGNSVFVGFGSSRKPNVTTALLGVFWAIAPIVNPASSGPFFPGLNHFLVYQPPSGFFVPKLLFSSNVNKSEFP